MYNIQTRTAWKKWGRGGVGGVVWGGVGGLIHNDGQNLLNLYFCFNTLHPLITIFLIRNLLSFLLLHYYAPLLQLVIQPSDLSILLFYFILQDEHLQIEPYTNCWNVKLLGHKWFQIFHFLSSLNFCCKKALKVEYRNERCKPFHLIFQHHLFVPP